MSHAHDNPRYVKLTDVLETVKERRYPVLDPADIEMTTHNNALWDVQRDIEALAVTTLSESAERPGLYRMQEQGKPRRGGLLR